MTTKRGGRTARENLWAAKQQAATTLSASERHVVEARQRVLLEKARVAAKLAKIKAAAAQAEQTPSPSDS